MLAVCLCAGCAISPDRKKPAEALAATANTAGADVAATQGQPATTGTTTTAAAQTPSPIVAPPGRAENGVSAQRGSQNSAVSGDELRNPASNPQRSAAPDPRVLDEVLGELASLGQIQPEAQKRLIEDLRKTDPAYWPMLVQTFRATLEYRRRNAQKVADVHSPTPSTSSDAAKSEVIQAAAVEPIKETASQPPVEQTQNSTTSPLQSLPSTAAAPPSSSTNGTGAQMAVAPADTPTTAPPAASEWRRHLDAAIAELDRQTRERPGDADALSNQVYLRLLDLAAGRRDEALKPIAGLSPPQQEYWAKQLFALSTYLDRSSGDPSRRAAEASLHLSRAVAALAEQGPLVVHNLTFCTDVHSYGVLKRFDPAEFRAGQKVLVYAEIENFKSEETSQGFHTSLEASYQILDRQGQRVVHDELSLTEEHCQNRRRDFFVRYFIDLPKNLYEGSYTLELTIEDKLGRKIGQSSIDFSIKK
jgi:hypothetical protein